MKPKILLRIAAIVMLLHLAGHLFGHLTWRMPEEPLQQEVVREMNAHAFPFMGAVHSMGDYYEGYGWISAAAMVFFALVLWIASTGITESPLLVINLLLALCGCLLIIALLELVFFFPFAASFTFVSALLGGMACLRIRSTSV